MSLLDSIRGLFTRKPKANEDQQGPPQSSDSGKGVKRWAAERMLGRKLRPGEVVHHKNRDSSDNSPGNLRVFKSQKEHDQAHKHDAK